MATINQITKMVTKQQGFKQIDDPGFITFKRTHPVDKREQAVRIFTWQNKKVAEKEGIPAGYLVVIPYLDTERGSGTRYRIPLFEFPEDPQLRKPATQQKKLDWKEVEKEYIEIFARAFDSSQETGEKILNGLSDRYQLT